MIKRLKEVFTFNGLFVLFGVFGSIASILTLFNTNYNFEINVKWLIFLIYVFICISFILIKFCYDLFKEIQQKDLSPNFTIIKYLQSTDEFLIDKTILLGHNALVSIFYYKEEFEVEIGKAFVSNISEKYIQIKILDISQNLSNDIISAIGKIRNNDTKELKNITIKTFVTRN